VQKNPQSLLTLMLIVYQNG